MPKGKKFDAAEKHFRKKEEQYLTRIRSLQAENAALQRDCARMRAELATLEDQVTAVSKANDQLERLLDVPEDKRKSMLAAGEVLKTFLTVTRGLRYD